MKVYIVTEHTVPRYGDDAQFVILKVFASRKDAEKFLEGWRNDWVVQREIEVREVEGVPQMEML